MNNLAPKTPQEALNKAMILVNNLRENLPGKVGKVLTCMDEIATAWEKQELDQFPFNLLHGEINALAEGIRSEYDDLNQMVDRTSTVYERIIDLQHRLRMSIEFVVSSKIFEGVERRFRRIDQMLPARNYGVRELLSELRAERIGPTIRQRMEAAVQRFDHQEYRVALQESGQAGEALFALYKGHLTQRGCDGISKNTGPALEHIRRWLAESENRDKREYSFSPRGRVEWLLLSMFELLHYLRNAASHALEVEEGLPPWQSQHRALCVEKPEYARLGLCLSFQIALEMQILLDPQGASA